MAQRAGEIEIGRRGIGRVCAEHDQRVDLAGLHVGDELGEALTMRCRRGGNRLDGPDCRAEIAEGPVDRVPEQLQISGLLGPEMDQRMAAVLLQIVGRGFQPGGVRSVRLLPAGGAGAERGGEVAQ